MNKKWYSIAGALAMTLVASVAFPAVSSAGEEQGSVQASLVESGSAAGRELRASGRLHGAGGMTCTATIISPAADPDPGARALILAAGHCVNPSMATNEIVVDKPAPAGWNFTPAYFKDNAGEHRKFTVEQISYATMKNTDVAVLRISATYGELAAMQVKPKTLTDTPPSGAAIQVGHAPTDGVPAGEQYMRLSSCTAQASGVSLHEGPWLWEGAVRTDCAGARGGSSGSAVTLVDEPGRIVAVLNTVASPDFLGCGRDRPCEGSTSGLEIPKDGTAYAVPVGAVASCLALDGVDLRRPGCRLEAAPHVSLQFPAKTTRSHTSEGDVLWDVRVTGIDKVRTTHTAFKVLPFGVGSCTDPSGYSTPRELGAEGTRSVHEGPLPTSDNLYVMCVAAGPGGSLSDPGWRESFAHPALAYTRVDNTSPTARPSVDVFETESDEGPALQVTPQLALWEINSYRVKYGQGTNVSCSNLAGYEEYIGFPALLEKSDGPWTYCLIGADYAGNQTPPAEFVLR
ncbi:trypsin-like peptidase domain-containing protein [Streptomyces sp. 4.24]|uniref:trypsin-like peptidase domain-containing protein n=1 Tax=Streptomyces tritrimontium TaxID=3406573 RepID=UPI003BB5DFB6